MSLLYRRNPKVLAGNCKGVSLTIPVNIAKKTWKANGKHTAFNPCGKASIHGTRKNPISWSTTNTWSSRIFVGLNVHGKAAFSVSDIVEFVKQKRIEQSGLADSSFITQRGVYTHREDGFVEDEKSVQIIIIYQGEGAKDKKETTKQFQENMHLIAEDMVVKFNQESVVVEIQKNGISQKTFGVVQ